MKNSRLKQALIRYLFPYGSMRVVFAGRCLGMKVKLTRQMGHSILIGYERANQNFLCAKIRPGMTIYDIGANCGQMALFFAKCVANSGCVVAFEPIDILYDQLVCNGKLNGLNNLSFQKTAIGNANGKTVFLFSNTYPTMGKMQNTEPTIQAVDYVEIAVEVKTLDSFLGQLSPPHVIKIDTEGSAGLVLEGALRTIQKHKPYFFIELHSPEERAVVQNYLGMAKYAIENLKGDKVCDLRQEMASPIWCYKREE